MIILHFEQLFQDRIYFLILIKFKASALIALLNKFKTIHFINIGIIPKSFVGITILS